MRLHDCVITLSRSSDPIGHLLQRRGSAWIADISADQAVAAGADLSAADRLRRRLLLSADMLTCAGVTNQNAIFDSLAASAVVIGNEQPSAIVRHVAAVASRSAAAAKRAPIGADRLRILMIGPVNSPHLEQLALEMTARGHLVQAGGASWGGGLAPSSLPETGIPVSVMTWPQVLWLRRLIRRFRPDVVHANWMPFAAAAVLAHARPLLAMAWGSDVYLASRAERLANRLAVARADLVLADSSALISRLVELGSEPMRTSLLNWGVDLESFRPAATSSERAELRSELGLRDAPVILSPRGLKALYNPTVVTEAFVRVLTTHPQAQLVVRHQGSEQPELGPLAGDDRVTVVGRLSYDRVADYYRAADVCVSIPDTDSSPRSVWEAMACGCPCVLSDLPWTRELITPGAEALLVSVQTDAVAAAITRLLEDRELADSVKLSALELVRVNRDARREMDRLEAFYFSLAGQPAPSPVAIASSSTSASSPVSARRE
jgi:glycosyltransferase involved in cell wall biosynthesis